jgi:hypothetical protein
MKKKRMPKNPGIPSRSLWEQLVVHYQEHPSLRYKADESLPLHLVKRLSIQNGLAGRRPPSKPSSFIKMNWLLRGLLPMLAKIERYLTKKHRWSPQQARKHLFLVGQLILDDLTQKTGEQRE